MKVALATWNGRISPVFDVARQILLLDVENGKVVARQEKSLPGREPQDQAAGLMTLGPQVLICGAVSKPMADLLAVTKIRVIPFAAGDVEQVLGAWLLGTFAESCFEYARLLWAEARMSGRWAAKSSERMRK